MALVLVLRPWDCSAARRARCATPRDRGAAPAGGPGVRPAWWVLVAGLFALPLAAGAFPYLRCSASTS